MSRIHGYSNEPWYNSYRSMMDRCYRKKAVNYENYGGRGIKVCDEWQTPSGFAAWVESNAYTDGMTIDRIDPNADYGPKNCRWATRKGQANNRRNTIFVEYKGERHTISEWADIIGINCNTLKTRYYRGWNAEDILGGGRGYVSVD